MLSKKGKVEKKPQNLEQHRRPGKWLDCGQKRRFAVSPHSYTEGKDNGEKEDLDEDDDDVINLTRTELLLERTEANPFRRIRFSPLPPSSSSSSSTSVSFL